MHPGSKLVAGVVAIGVAALLYGASPAASTASTKAEERVEVPPPPFSDGIFPCMNCHANQKPNRTRRTLTDMHTDIVLKHDEQHR